MDYQKPWLVGGAFNMFLNKEENMGGLPVTIDKVQDFNHCIKVCSLTDVGFK